VTENLLTYMHNKNCQNREKFDKASAKIVHYNFFLKW